MKKYLITIDGGTTNTRAVLWNDRAEHLHVVKSPVGVKNTAESGTNDCLKQSVKKLVQELLDWGKLTFEDIAGIYASGMLTSNVGLVEVPHLTAPAGEADFVEHVKTVVLEDICPLPIHFIPGLKNLDGKIALDQLESMDIMRGEEVEALALLDLYPAKEGRLIVLPGSHTKFVTVNPSGQLTGCLTSLAGELIEVLTRHTILADAVGRQFAPESFDREMLMAGCRNTWSTGLTRTAFLTRIVSQFVSSDPAKGASFLLGAVLAEDITAVKASRAFDIRPDMKVIIAGKEPLLTAFQLIFAEDGSFKDVEVRGPGNMRPLSGYGAYLVARRRGDI